LFKAKIANRAKRTQVFVIIFPVRQVTFASSSLSLSAEKVLSFSLTQRVIKNFKTSDFLKLDGVQKLRCPKGRLCWCSPFGGSGWNDFSKWGC
jgi:hypothetical protein